MLPLLPCFKQKRHHKLRIAEKTAPCLRMMYYSVSDTGKLRKGVEPTEELPITSSDALPLSYRRLVGAKAIKLGSWDKQPAYC